MADELADLVLPDLTPVKNLPEEEEAKPATKRRRKGTKSPTSLVNIRLPKAGDFAITACGVGLAALCAVFPWYIFFHQEQFGIRPLAFAGGTPSARGLEPEARADFADGPQLDFIPTGAVPETLRFDDASPFDMERIPEQPFPGNRVSFRLLHAANGRAMIEDEAGFWLVRHGSSLPDGSRVAKILQRGDTWVLVTSEKREVTLTR